MKVRKRALDSCSLSSRYASADQASVGPNAKQNLKHHRSHKSDGNGANRGKKFKVLFNLLINLLAPIPMGAGGSELCDKCRIDFVTSALERMLPLT